MLTEVLSTIAKFLSVSWRAGAALAVFGGVSWLLRYYDVPPFRDLPQDWYQGVSLVGLLGFGFVAVQVIVLISQGVAFVAGQIGRKIAAVTSLRRTEREAVEAEQRTRETALENLKCASRADLQALLWMKAHNRQRFKGYPYPQLRILSEGLLLEKLNGTSEGTHWRVPDHIWAELDDLKHLGPKIIVLRQPGTPPWEVSPYV